jgi:hypothetical protein
MQSSTERKGEKQRGRFSTIGKDTDSLPPNARSRV